MAASQEGGDTDDREQQTETKQVVINHEFPLQTRINLIIAKQDAEDHMDSLRELMLSFDMRSKSKDEANHFKKHVLESIKMTIEFIMKCAEQNPRILHDPLPVCGDNSLLEFIINMHNRNIETHRTLNQLDAETDPETEQKDDDGVGQNEKKRKANDIAE